MIASIPSPSFNSIDIGPFSLNIYGLCIAIGVVAAVWLFGKRLEERGVGTRDDASSIGIVAVLAGVVGARLYHVVTDWDRFEGNYDAIPRIWEGGLGIPGGLLFGITVGLWMSKRKGIGIAVAATCAAPAIPLAQAIGRLGNYFNQELYGGPTDLPWALEIDAQHLEPGYALGTTFHPTFLYESLWSLALVFVLLWIDRRWRPPDGQLMVMYLIGYGIGRFWVEGLRIDPADEFGGLRLNQWVALVAVVAGFAVLAFWPDQDSSDTAADDVDGSDGVEVSDAAADDVHGSDVEVSDTAADDVDGSDGVEVSDTAADDEVDGSDVEVSDTAADDVDGSDDVEVSDTAADDVDGSDDVEVSDTAADDVDGSDDVEVSDTAADDEVDGSDDAEGSDTGDESDKVGDEELSGG